MQVAGANSIVSNTGLTGWRTAAREFAPGGATEVIGASELFSSWLMTRITFSGLDLLAAEFAREPLISMR